MAGAAFLFEFVRDLAGAPVLTESVSEQKPDSQPTNCPREMFKHSLAQSVFCDPPCLNGQAQEESLK
jgi:hypothetical protein